MKHLRSWKEIARHLGSSVRTIQRREAEGLPIRRTIGMQRGRVIAYAEELDTWAADQFVPTADLVGQLRGKIRKLKAEIVLLKATAKLRAQKSRAN